LQNPTDSNYLFNCWLCPSIINCMGEFCKAVVISQSPYLVMMARSGDCRINWTNQSVRYRRLVQPITASDTIICFTYIPSVYIVFNIVLDQSWLIMFFVFRINWFTDFSSFGLSVKQFREACIYKHDTRACTQAYILNTHVFISLLTRRWVFDEKNAEIICVILLIKSLSYV